MPKKGSRSDAERAAADFLQAIRNVSQRYPGSAKPYFTYDYFRRDFDEQNTERNQIINSFVSILQK
jgi:hypothetical protein